jgi:hypothetical protein
MKKMVIFFFVESLFGPQGKRVDLSLVIAWAGIAVALWILLAVR